MILDDFCEWLKNTTFSSRPKSTSPKKYKGGVSTISSEMLQKEIIHQPLEDMSLEQFDIALFNIIYNEDFIRKDSIGHKMYSNSLKHFRMFLKASSPTLNTVSEEINKINSNRMLKATEKESLIKSRIGQGKFRNEILKKYNGACIISGITDARLLVASHVKPWSVSDNDNRLSSENGLLLSSLYDKMFDLGLISFSEDGKLLISNELTPENTALAGLKKENSYSLKYTSLLSQNMEYHRDVIFLRG